MKKLLAVLLLPCLALSLCACAGRNEPPAADAAWHYNVSTEPEDKKFYADDGTLVATRSLDLAYLEFECSGTDEATVRKLRETCDTFNAAMDAVRDEADEAGLAEMGREGYEWSRETGVEFVPYSDEFGVTGVFLSDTMVSVVGAGSSYTGGAHPNNYMSAWNYDLKEGKFFDVNDLGDDAAALRGVIAESVLKQIEAEGDADGYFPGYEETVRGAESFHVYFDEKGMTVWFPEYDIAPHAAGIPMFDISYAELAPYLNEYGAALLGQTS